MIKNRVNQNGFSAVVVALIVLILGIIVFTGWYVYNSAQKNKSPQETTGQQSNPAKSTPSPSAQSTYVNTKFKYSFVVPEGYVVSESVNCEGYCNSTLSLNKKLNDFSSEETGIAVLAGDNKTKDSLQDLINQQKFNEYDKKLSDTKIGGNDAVKYFKNGMVGENMYLFANGTIDYRIMAYDSNDKTYNSAFESIAKTFKFN